MDASSSTCASERILRLRHAALAELYLLGPPSAAYGQTVRIVAGLELGGCDRLADVQIQADPDARSISVTGLIWEEVGEGLVCDGALWYAEEILALNGLGPGDWTVEEAPVYDTGLAVGFIIVGCPASDCECLGSGPGTATAGAYCNFDCQCLDDLQCLHRPAGGRECGLSCSTDAQCAGWEYCSLVDGTLWGVCHQAQENKCTAGGCPAGFLCTTDGDTANHCEAVFDPIDFGQPCACHQECPQGLWCADIGDVTPGCWAPCRGATDCPSGVPCGRGFTGNLPICAAYR